MDRLLQGAHSLAPVRSRRRRLAIASTRAQAEPQPVPSPLPRRSLLLQDERERLKAIHPDWTAAKIKTHCGEAYRVRRLLLGSWSTFALPSLVG